MFSKNRPLIYKKIGIFYNVGFIRIICSKFVLLSTFTYSETSSIELVFYLYVKVYVLTIFTITSMAFSILSRVQDFDKVFLV